MTTLTTTPLSPLLERLFEEADAVSLAAIPAVAELSREQQERLMRSKTGRSWRRASPAGLLTLASR